MAWINAACCERCWITREGTWEQSPDDPELQRLVALREPVRLNPPDRGPLLVENCHFCHWPTFAGIYVRTEDVITDAV